SGFGSADNVAVVDTQRVQKEAPLAKQYVEKHEQKVQEINKKLAEEKLSMSDEDFQKEQQKQKQELDIYSAGLQRQFKSDLDQKLAEIAKDKEVGIIVDKRAVPNGGIDVTDEVIAKLQ
uniref:OmpH family outer membrane protein n=1 Tax=Megasphaera micronuciformis TaxID=187326 RepID=UPI004029FE76